MTALSADDRVALLDRVPSLPIALGYKIAGAFSRDEILSRFEADAWSKNYALNLWEYVNRVDRLESLPWNVALPIADLCNARCTFCNSWLRGRSIMRPEHLERYVELLRVARLIGLQGHGEPLVNPHIEAILDRIAEVADKRASTYIITNAMHLEKHLERLTAAHVTTYNVSLNATTPKTHDIVMGLGEDGFERALSAIRRVLALKATNPRIQVTISMVLTADNLDEAVDFVLLGNQLHVDRIYLRTLFNIGNTWAKGLNYNLLPPRLHPNHERIFEMLREEIRLSEVPIAAQPETWAEDCMSPELRSEVTAKPPERIGREEAIRRYSPEMRALDADGMTPADRDRYRPLTYGDENPYGRTAPFDCAFVYHNLVATELTFRINPCCYMSDVPGHKPVIYDGSKPFAEYWNSEAFVFLRRSLREGPLIDNCRVCPMQGH